MGFLRPRRQCCVGQGRTGLLLILVLSLKSVWCLPSVEGIHVATMKKDDLLHQRGWLSISTVASAKGYDGYCVLLCGADGFPTDVQGRASFYDACARAIEYLEAFGTRRAGLLLEFDKAISAVE